MPTPMPIKKMMSSDFPQCICMGPRSERMKNWVVVLRNGNYSAFERPKMAFHHSDYSSVYCSNCQRLWRTRAKYVPSLPDGEITWEKSNVH